MWFKLASATFTNHLGNMSELSNSWPISYSLSSGLSRGSSSLNVTKGGNVTITLVLSSGATYNNDLRVTVGGSVVSITPSVSGSNITFTLNSVNGAVVVSASATGAVVTPPAGGGSGGNEPSTPNTPTNYPFDTSNLVKFDLSTATWEQGTVGNGGASGVSTTRIRTTTPYSVPYDNVKFYVKVNSPYVGGLRSGTSNTNTPLNQYWFSNDSNYGGGVSSTIPNTNIGWEITIPTGHTMFWPVLAVGDGTTTNNTTNILPADASSTGFELWYVDKSTMSFSVHNYVDNVQVANCKNSVNYGEGLTATYTANSGFTLPDSIEVEGGTLTSWDKSTGTATITNIIDTLNITVSGTRSNIPTDYTPVSYIKMKAANSSQDTQTGFSTGVVASNVTGGEYCFKQLNAGIGSIKTNGVYETSIADSAKRRWYMPYFEQNQICAGWNDLKRGQTISDAAELHVASTNKENCRKAYIDGEVITGADNLESLTLESTPVGIGTLCDNGAIVSMASNSVDCKYYWIKLWQDSNLVRDMVPVLRKSDNEPGFYDFVENKFYANEGAVPFTYA